MGANSLSRGSLLSREYFPSSFITEISLAGSDSQVGVAVAGVPDVGRAAGSGVCEQRVGVARECRAPGEQDQVERAVLVLVGELDRRLAHARRGVVVATHVAVPAATHNTTTSVREYVFFVSFGFQKNTTFYVFFEMTYQKVAKSHQQKFSPQYVTKE